MAKRFYSTFLLKLSFWAFLLTLVPLFAQETSPEKNPKETFLERTPHFEIPEKVSEEPPPFPFPDQPSEVPETNFMAQFINMLLMLGLLIGLMFFCSWFLKRMMASRIQQVNTDSNIKVIEYRPLSNRTTVYVLDIEGQKYVLAETPTSVVNLEAVKNDQ